MLVASYNNKAFDDLLIVQLKESAAKDQDFEKKEEISRIFDKETNETNGEEVFKIGRAHV